MLLPALICILPFVIAVIVTVRFSFSADNQSISGWGARWLPGTARPLFLQNLLHHTQARADQHHHLPDPSRADCTADGVDTTIMATPGDYLPDFAAHDCELTDSVVWLDHRAQ